MGTNHLKRTPLAAPHLSHDCMYEEDHGKDVVLPYVDALNRGDLERECRLSQTAQSRQLGFTDT